MYFEVKALEVLDKLAPHFRSGSLVYREDGKIKYNTTLMWDGPWLHQRQSPGKRCHIDHGLLFPVFNIISSRCLECFKVVVRPRTLEELMKLYQIQKRLQLPSKCGIETRPSVHGNYGGYFYNNSVEEGIQCWEIVRKAVDEEISRDVSVILKRGCTEYEMDAKYADSTKWAQTPLQEETQRILDDILAVDLSRISHTPEVINRTLCKWVEHAYGIGDKTYLLYTDGKPLYKPYVTYHPEVRPWEKEEDNGRCGCDENTVQGE